MFYRSEVVQGRDINHVACKLLEFPVCLSLLRMRMFECVNFQPFVRIKGEISAQIVYVNSVLCAELREFIPDDL